MAASLDGVFRIIDRASPAMRSMERQALKTDAAITKLGLSLDTIGSKKQLKQFDQVERGIRNLGVEGETATKKVERGVTKLDKTMRRHGSTWAVFRRGVKDTVGELAKFTMMGLKIGGIGAMIGTAAQGIGNLAGGVTALLPRFGQLLGGMGAALPLFGALAQSAIVAKVAFGGLTQAMAGNARALHQLAPAGQRFVKQWQFMRRDRLALTRGIQQPLFEQINAPFKSAFHRARPVLQRSFGGVSRAIGGVGARALNSFSTPQFLQQFSKLSGGSASIVTRLGGAAINLAHGFTEVAIAAQPVVSWLTKSISLWAKHWSATQKVNASTGKLSTRFTNARKALTGLWRTGKDIFKVFQTIMHAATPLGDTLYGAANRSMERWVKFHNTIAGRQGLMNDFQGLERGFRGIARLVGALGGALFKMGSQGGLAKTADALTKMVPALAKGLNTFANSLGPALAQGIGAVVGLFSTLGTGPLPLVVHGITALLQGITGIVKASGPFKGVFTAIFSTALISRYLVKLGLLEKGWWNVARAATVAGAAENGASAGGVLGPVGRGVAGGFGRLKGFIRPSAATKLERGVATGTMTDFATGTAFGAGRIGLGARAAGMGAGLLGAGRAALGIGGKLLWPLAAISGILGGLTAQRSGSFGHQVAQTAFGAVNPLTFGLLGKTGLSDYLATPAQKAARYVSHDNTSMQTDLASAGAGRTGLAKLTAELTVLEQHANKLRGSRQQEYQDYMTQLKDEIASRKALVAQLKAEKNQKDRGTANVFLGALTRAAQTLQRKHGVTQGFHEADVMGLQYLNTGGLNRAGRRQVETGLLRNALRRGTPAEYAQVKGAITGIEASKGNTISIGPGGRIFQGTPAEIQSLKRQLKLPDARVNARRRNFITQELAAAYDAANRSAERQQTKHASGGRLGGRGLGDTVPVPGGMAAPGELVVNRHTERRVNGLLSGFGTSLGGMVGREGRPHSAPMYATGGRLGGWGLKSGISSLGSSLLSRFPGLSVTSGLRPGDTGSYHALGEAIDLGGPAALMGRAAHWIQAHLAGRLLEGIHNSGLSVKNGKVVPPSFWGAKTWGAHANHIHLAAGAGGLLGTSTSADGSASSGAAATKLNLGFFDPGNLSGFGGISTRGYSAMGSKGAGATASAAPGPGGRYSKAALRALAGRVGFPMGKRGIAAAVALAESSGRPNAFHKNTNGTIDRGLWEINSIHGGLSTFDPVANAKAAYSISKGGTDWGPWTTYNNGAYKKFMAAKGGRVPKFAGWFGRGGSITATGPTMVGVGERGKPEKVTIGPASSSSTKGSGAVFAPVVHVYGASQEDVEAALDTAMHRFADILDRTSVEGADIAV